tara:strand:+ start:429 stop:1634 length:1206 start_codon:yes stop_codon:yes gene_type:complete
MHKTEQKKRVLYISYDGIMEPLGYSQVLKYLEYLSIDFDVTLISYEKSSLRVATKGFLQMKQYCNEKNINWQPRKYHRGLFLVSHLINISSIFFAPFFQMLKNKHQIVHIRSYMPGLGIPLLKMLFDFKFIFDIRGFWADEKVDRLGWSNNSYKYKFFKKLEMKLVHKADFIVTLTEASKEFIQKKFNKSANSITVIRTCVDFSEFNINKRSKKTFNLKSKLVIGYLGSIDTAYDFNAFLNLIKNLEKRGLKVNLKILSDTTPEIVLDYLKISNLGHLEHEVLFLDRKLLSEKINQFDLLGFALKQSFSLIASMPTKIAESLACGTPIICNNFNKDIEEMINSYRIGILYDFSSKLTQENYEKIISIVQDKMTPSRCNEFSKEHFSLSLGTNKYSEIYKNL